eukprot:5980244-Prorocentrum_lima.AAC.1
MLFHTFNRIKHQCLRCRQQENRPQDFSRDRIHISNPGQGQVRQVITDSNIGSGISDHHADPVGCEMW